jgi:hypothetical protein
MEFQDIIINIGNPQHHQQHPQEQRYEEEAIKEAGEKRIKNIKFYFSGVEYNLEDINGEESVSDLRQKITNQTGLIPLNLAIRSRNGTTKLILDNMRLFDSISENDVITSVDDKAIIQNNNNNEEGGEDLMMNSKTIFIEVKDDKLCMIFHIISIICCLLSLFIWITEFIPVIIIILSHFNNRYSDNDNNGSTILRTTDLSGFVRKLYLFDFFLTYFVILFILCLICIFFFLTLGLSLLIGMIILIPYCFVAYWLWDGINNCA